MLQLMAVTESFDLYDPSVHKKGLQQIERLGLSEKKERLDDRLGGFS